MFFGGYIMTIQEMLKQKQELGYSYEQIAELSQVPLSTVRKVLGGKTKSPRYATLTALARAFPSPHPAGQAESAAHVHPGQRTDRVAEHPVPYNTAAYKQQGKYTLEDYLALPDDLRVELIDGVFYDMSSPTGFHQLIAGQLHAMLLAWIRSRKGSCMPFISPIDVQLDSDDKTIIQPDVIVLCDKNKYTPARIIGAPDFVAEVLSPSTRSRDMFLKLNKYRSAGVLEYWMIDPEKKIIITYLFGKNDDYSVYSFRDVIPVGIYNGELTIDFSQIDDFVSDWM